MQKHKGRSLNAIHRNPLPIKLSVHTYGELPQLIPHNPVSWVYFCYRLAFIYLQQVPQALEPRIVVDVAENGSVFKVCQEADMMRLWNQGFFGKGTLSRSDPSWKQRVQRRLNLDGGLTEVTKEEITDVRRGERKKFKELRSRFQKFESMARKQALTEADVEEMERIRIQLAEVKLEKENFDVLLEEFDASTMRKEDLDIIEDRKLKENLECLQLQKVETFFLKLLDVVEVRMPKDDVVSDGPNSPESEVPSGLSTKQLYELCAGDLEPSNPFILDYVVYHHYRSLGWCVRSGIKFGCDMLLYKRGPPFMHAEYAIFVIPNTDEWKEWEDIMAAGRVIGGVKKTMILVYVDIPAKELFVDKFDKLFVEVLQLYKVTEIVYRRWIPSRTRD